jgi:hypothetical protein
VSGYGLRCLLVCGLWVIGCGDRTPAGAERGPCYGNGTCEPGLLCLSDLCVNPVGSVPADVQRASEEVRRAGREAELAPQKAKEAQDRVASLARDFKDFDKRLGDAQAALIEAETETERRTAQAKFEELRRQKLDLERRVQAAKDAAASAERTTDIHLSKECLDNPLGQGCT